MQENTQTLIPAKLPKYLGLQEKPLFRNPAILSKHHSLQEKPFIRIPANCSNNMGAGAQGGAGQTGNAGGSDDNVVDADYTVVDDDNKQN